MKSIYDFSVKTISGEEKSLADYKGKVMLIVNTASKCGFMKCQYDCEEGKDLLGFLKSDFPSFILGDSIKWNFTKFLVNREGEVVARFEPITKPEKIESSIEKLL